MMDWLELRCMRINEKIQSDCKNDSIVKDEREKHDGGDENDDVDDDDNHNDDEDDDVFVTMLGKKSKAKGF